MINIYNILTVNAYVERFVYFIFPFIFPVCDIYAERTQRDDEKNQIFFLFRWNFVDFILPFCFFFLDGAHAAALTTTPPTTKY